MKRAFCLAFSLAAALLGSSLSMNSVHAQSSGLVELYGEGVHRYFAGDMAGADELFSRVIDGGSQDPRAYFFRGLIRERQGGAGQFDFEQGAQMEAAGRASFPVGQALTRIQGSVRGKIEKARRDARVMFAQQRAMMKEAAPAVPSETAETTPAPPSETEGMDPFGAEGGMRADNATEDAAQPADPEIDATTDPFTDDPTPAGATDAGSAQPDAPTTEDPFGGAGDATTDPGDPFGGAGDAPATEDPFGDAFGDF
ncbi:MAG: hypothetical protein ACE361_21190 [Aureliella sp.]